MQRLLPFFVLASFLVCGNTGMTRPQNPESEPTGAVAKTAQPATAAVPPTAKAFFALSEIDQRVQDWQPTAEERRMDEIGWANSLREALRLAKEHQRPVFLFTYSGEATEPNAIALRRC